ncbi:hypothetical protein BDZ89DRAFT_1135969 [Hymenopellis radicata]|nr:hypothetical protein BDZ89DRAFT_1135969 [Hymenopellis radicata]
MRLVGGTPLCLKVIFGVLISGVTVNDFPVLERLRLFNPGTGGSGLHHLRSFSNAPQLKTLFISDTATPAGFPTTRQELRAITSPFEWGSLSHLTIDMDFSWMSYTFFKSCPNLFSFRDLSRQDNWSGKEDWPVLRHPCLRVLHSNNPSFLHRIRCTALEEFSIPLVPGEEALSRAAALFPARSLTFILDNRIPSRPFIETNIQSAIKRISRHQCSTRLCLDVRRASFRHILVLCKLIAAHSTIFPYMSHLVLRLRHQAPACSEDSVCLLSSPADASALGIIMYELQIRNSPERLNLVTFEVLCSMKKCPDCVKDFITQFRQLKPSTLNVEFFMPSQLSVFFIYLLSVDSDPRRL